MNDVNGGTAITRVSGSALSLYVFGTYSMINGLLSATVPNIILPLAGFQLDPQPWVRMGGVLIALIGFYYIVAARHNLVPFFRATVLGRIVVVSATIVFSIVLQVQPQIVYLALPDLAGAIWTFIALRKESH